MNCAFCRIIAGEDAAQHVYEDDVVAAFLDRRPLFPGHVLVVPRSHLVSFSDLDALTLTALFQTVQVISNAVEAAMQCEGTFVALNNRVSQSVPHVHVHVVPRNKGDGLRGFFWPRNGYRDDAHAEEVRDLIRSAIDYTPKR